MAEFLNEVELGHIKLSNINDYSQLYKMFTEVNDLTTGNEQSGNGAPPELSDPERDSLEKHLNAIDKRIKDAAGKEHDKKQIKATDIANLKPKEVDKIAADRSQAINNVNGGFDDID